jgi:hypothetical protein
MDFPKKVVSGVFELPLSIFYKPKKKQIKKKTKKKNKKKRYLPTPFSI